MPAKNIYMGDQFIAYIKKQAKKEGRSFSGYLLELIRADMKKKVKK